MTTTDPTPLAEQIAREHHLYLIDPDENETRAASAVCECDHRLDIVPGDFPERVIAAHIATVTEQAVREQVAAGIEAAAAVDTGWPADPEQIALTYRRAARIARGGPDA